MRFLADMGTGALWGLMVFVFWVLLDTAFYNVDRFDTYVTGAFMAAAAVSSYRAWIYDK